MAARATNSVKEELAKKAETKAEPVKVNEMPLAFRGNICLLFKG